MIEIILLNQLKLSLFGVIRQIIRFCVTLFDNFNDISNLQQLIMQYDVYKVWCAYQTNLNILNQEVRYGKTVEDVPLSFQEFFQIRQT